jgi:hypothetical protein
MATVGNPDDMSGVPSPQPAMMRPDLTFTMKGLLGDHLLRASGPNQYLKSVTVGAEDITDTPREFKTGDRVTITLTSRASTVEGNVADASGAASADAGIMIFSDDKASWRFNSARLRRSTVDANGHFRIAGLMPGRYFVAALPRERLNMPMNADPAFFEELSKVATSLTIGEDEERKVDLKIVAGKGDQH